MNHHPERHQIFQLRLCPSIREQAMILAQDDDVFLNYFITLAIAEKLSRIEQELSNREPQDFTRIEEKSLA
jgi:hypothetical protein